ncbi:hypothetical protein ENSA7_25130 [Enhygromyxa salina]|uniref:Uncharacterized protein n=1 Tax=Enhygromyxa salina TaxID=215803 RepID=A0A2S9YRZ3_9BACT|nr:hypothetical protein ENSA7_25130 [Enhygromyxa salina]
MASAKRRQARVADLDPLGGELLVDPHQVALAAAMQLADAREVIVEYFVAVERRDLGDPATQDLADRPAREVQDSHDRPDAVSLGGQAQKIAVRVSRSSIARLLFFRVEVPMQGREAALGSSPRDHPCLVSACRHRLAAFARASAQTQAHRREHRQILQRRGGLVVLGLGLCLGLEGLQKQSRLRAQSLADLVVGLFPGHVQPRHLAHARALGPEVAHDPFAVVDVGPGQGHEDLGRDLHADFSSAH